MSDEETMQPLQPVKCISFSDPKERIRNMKYAFKLNIPRLNEMVMVQSDEIAIVAGGPSLNHTYKDVSKFKIIMSCGSAHDHILSLGIKPTYHIDCDPAKAHVQNLKRDNPDCTYLIASRCNRNLFDRLKNKKMRLWHMWESDLGRPAYKGEPAFICGATVVLAAIPVALALGFKNFHFFGFDSSFEDDKHHHAYPQDEFATMMTARVGDPKTGRDFRTTATWIGQAQQFEEMRNNWGHLFNVNVYGDSMIAEMHKLRTKQYKGVHK